MRKELPRRSASMPPPLPPAGPAPYSTTRPPPPLPPAGPATFSTTRPPPPLPAAGARPTPTAPPSCANESTAVPMNTTAPTSADFTSSSSNDTVVPHAAPSSSAPFAKSTTTPMAQLLPPAEPAARYSTTVALPPTAGRPRSSPTVTSLPAAAALPPATTSRVTPTAPPSITTPAPLNLTPPHNISTSVPEGAASSSIARAPVSITTPAPLNLTPPHNVSDTFVPKGPASNSTTRVPPPPPTTGLGPKLAPSPSPEAPPTHKGIDILDKYVCGVGGSSLAVLLVYLPFLHLLMYGNFEETTTLWSARGTEIGLGNNLVWLLYGAVVLKRDKPYDVILGNSWCGAANLAYLLALYSRNPRKEERKKGLWVFLLVIICVGSALILFQIEVSSETTKLLEIFFGVAGNLVLLVSHFVQIIELWRASAKKELRSALMVVAPNAAFATIQCVSSFIKHRDEIFIMASCVINAIAFPLETLLICGLNLLLKKKVVQVKEGSQRTLRRMKTSMKRTYTSFRIPIADEEKGRQTELVNRNEDLSVSSSERKEPSSPSVDFEEEMNRTHEQYLDLIGRIKLNLESPFNEDMLPKYDSYEGDSEIEDSVNTFEDGEPIYDHYGDSDGQDEHNLLLLTMGSGPASRLQSYFPPKDMLPKYDSYEGDSEIEDSVNIFEDGEPIYDHYGDSDGQDEHNLLLLTMGSGPASRLQSYFPPKEHVLHHIGCAESEEIAGAESEEHAGTVKVRKGQKFKWRPPWSWFSFHCHNA